MIENGRVTEDINEYNEHEILHFVCKERFKRTEDRPSKCTKIGMTADWSPTPACERTFKLINLIYCLYHPD